MRKGPHSCGGPVVFPAALPGREHQARVLRAAEAAVVAHERAKIIAVLLVDVVAQDGAAVGDVGAQVEEVVLRRADQLDPERHDLHVAARSRGRHRVLAEGALHLDHAEHQLRVETRARRFGLDGAQQLEALLAVGDALLEALVHRFQPAPRVVLGAEVHPRRGAGGHLRGKPLADAVGEGLVLLLARQRSRRGDDERGEEQSVHASFWRISANVTSDGFTSRRPLYSYLSAPRRSESTTRCGMPIRSMSANRTPGRSSRSSSSTSIFSARSVSYSLSAAARTSFDLW